ncbi:MAG: molybdopterin-dependent oxidoreductase, partial [Paracoccaceae bacterium]
LAPTEAAFALKELVEGLGGSVECRTDGAKLPAGNRGAYVGTALVEDLDHAGRILLIGTNPRTEAPVLNARIRKAWLRGAQVSRIGEPVDLTFDVEELGDGRDAFAKLPDIEGEGESIVIVGQGALMAEDGENVLAHALKAAADLDAKVMILHTAAARVGAMDIGAVTDGGLMAALDGAEVIYNLGADEGDIQGDAFVIYQGSHGDRGAHRADVILPAAAYTEENGLFVNTEGRPQLAMRAGFAPGEAKENWAILRALSAELGATLPYDSLTQLRQALVARHPHLAEIDTVPENQITPIEPTDLASGPVHTAIKDFYLTNPIARASELMAELSANAKLRFSDKIAAE